MKEKSNCFKTNPAIFQMVLGKAIEDIGQRKFLTESGYFFLYNIPYPRPDLYSVVSHDKTFIEIKGRFVSSDKIETMQLMTFEVRRLAEDMVEVRGDCHEQAIDGYFDELFAKFAGQWETSGVPTREMRDETRKRAYMFREIKNANTRLSYTQVAMKAREMGYPDATEDDVRNDYRAMTWDWERADEVR